MPSDLNRRAFIALASAFVAARSAIGKEVLSDAASRVGLCTFSCKAQWQAVRKEHPRAAFLDVQSFYDYARKLGGDGVQTSVRGISPESAKSIRKHVEETGGYFEGDVRLPKGKNDLAEFETELIRVKEAGASVARVILLGGRRYEVFKSLDEFNAFRANGIRRLELAEPLARKHRIKLAWENHKDFLVPEQLEILNRIDSEWLGVLVDTGNNIALCEDPYEVVEALAPHVVSVHLKDMAVQSSDEGILLSEVPFGTGFLDLKRIVRTLTASNKSVDFHVEMATRDPLSVPCNTDAYWSVFPERRDSDLERTLSMVAAHPPKAMPPIVSGKTLTRVLREEEDNNSASLVWADGNIG